MPTPQARRCSFSALIVASAFTLSACGADAPSGPRNAAGESAGQISAVNAELYDVMSLDAQVELLAEGFGWAEGPTWDAAGAQLLFVRVRDGQLFAWNPSNLLQDLGPLGNLVAASDDDAISQVTGLLSHNDELLVADFGGGRLLSADLGAGRAELLSDAYDGVLLQGPNDVIRDDGGALYFTDPGPSTEFSAEERYGVYRLASDGALSLIAEDMERPNGLALSPDDRFLYVSNTDQADAVVQRYELSAYNGAPIMGEAFFDARDYAKLELAKLDGMAVDETGRIFVAAGVAGVLVLDAYGYLSGVIETDFATSNVTFGGPVGRSLFITGNSLAKVETLTRAP